VGKGEREDELEELRRLLEILRREEDLVLTFEFWSNG